MILRSIGDATTHGIVGSEMTEFRAGLARKEYFNERIIV